MKPHLIIILSVMVFPINAQQLFTRVDNAVAQLALGSCSFGDIDKDGDADLLLTGEYADHTGDVAVYLNANGSFTRTALGIKNIYRATTDMGDFDNDGDLDIIIGGGNDFYLYVNEDLSFTEVDLNGSDTRPPNDAKFVDLDNDGKLEILSVGWDFSNAVGFAHIYKVSNGLYQRVTHNLPPGFVDSKISIADFNEDGWNDLLISNRETVKVFMNQKNLTFEENTIKPSGNSYNQSATGDFNNDGFTDFVLCGAVDNIGDNAYLTKIYLNNGAGEFHAVDGALPDIFSGILRVADFNMDGLDDIFLSGMNTYPTETTLVTGFFQNNGDMTFTKLDEETDPVRANGDAQVVDINNDTKPDLFVSGVHYPGSDTHMCYATFYINNSSAINEAPAIPHGLDMERNGSMVTFKWNKSLDDHDNFPKYNIRIGTNPGSIDVLSPPVNGDYPLVLENFTTADTFKVIDIHAYEKLYVSVQALDNSLRYSAFSATQDFTFPKADFTLSEDTVCTETIFTASFNGFSVTAPVFKWFVNDVRSASLTEAEASFHFHDPGKYRIKLIIEDGGVESPAVEHQVVVSEQPQLTFSHTGSACLDQPYAVSYLGTFPEQAIWNFGDATVISGTGAGPYELSWNTGGEKTIDIDVKNEGCLKTETLTVLISNHPNVPSLCAVSVDDTTGKNKIVWRYTDPNVHEFNIYKETEEANHYAFVGSVSGTGTIAFTDEASKPEQHSDAYRISAVDTCGFETAFSAAHRTIHLAINKGIGKTWNLIWTRYEGLSFDSYRIYRGEGRQNLTFLQDVSSNVTSFTDLDAPSDNIYYSVEALLTTLCDPAVLASYRSNVAYSLISGVDESAAGIVVSPNPVYGTLYVKSSGSRVSYSLTDSRGYSIAAGEVKEQQVDLSQLASGIYLLTVTQDGYVFVKRIVKL